MLLQHAPRCDTRAENRCRASIDRYAWKQRIRKARTRASRRGDVETLSRADVRRTKEDLPPALSRCGLIIAIGNSLCPPRHVYIYIYIYMHYFDMENHARERTKRRDRDRSRVVTLTALVTLGGSSEPLMNIVGSTNNL